MKFFKLNHAFLKEKSCLLLLIFILLLQNPEADAQQKGSKKKEKHFEAEFSFATIYDNNILKYSEKYLDRFLNNEDKGRFHIDTYDDIILYPSLGLTSTFRIFKKVKSKINFNFNNSTYTINGIKSWMYLSTGFQQYITKRASFKVLYSYIPDFYVRHFRDDDWVEVYGYTPETFVPFGFSKDNFGFWIQNTFFKNTRVKLSLDYARYFHNKHYTEYDCNNYLFGGNIYQQLNKKLKLEIGYVFVTSDAKGFDEPGESKEDTDDSDASYKANEYFLGFTWQMPRFKKHDHDLDIGAEFEKRYYLSEHYYEVDPEHAGRIDNNFKLQVLYAIELNKSFKLSAFYNYFMRNSNTSAVENQSYLSEEKDYRQSQAGLKITYNLTF